jgi:hypothetical protein
MRAITITVGHVDDFLAHNPLVVGSQIRSHIAT